MMYIDINAAGCSNTCRHCSVSGCFPDGGFYSLEELRLIKKEWGALTIRYEPTLHPDFPEIYSPEIASDHGGWLVSNGSGLANREDFHSVFTKMLAMRIDTIAFTLHGLEAHHDWFVCRQGAFDDLVLATQRARIFGFSIRWQVFVDNKGIGDLPALIDLAIKETGDVPSLTVPYHRVGGRLWNYEKLRLSLSQVEKFHLPNLIDNPDKNIFIQPQRLISQKWLRLWMDSPGSDEFKHPFEPRTWCPDVNYPLSLRIERNRKVYFDPMCHAPIFLGYISEGKDAILQKLAELPMPFYTDLRPEEVDLSPLEQEQIHPSGFSLRYKEISKKQFRKIASHFVLL